MVQEKVAFCARPRAIRVNTRRHFLRAIVSSIALLSFATGVQGQTRPRRIGFLWEEEQSVYVYRVDAFKAGMRALGYADGRDYTIEQRSAQADLTRLPALAAELLALRVDLFVSSGTPSAIAASKVTRDVPILIVTVGDPIGSGLAASLRRPGGNVTGLTSLSIDLYTKRLDLLRQILPASRRVGFLYNPDNGNDILALRQFESDCSKLEFKSLRAPVRSSEEIAAAFNSLQHDKAQALISTSMGWRANIIEQASKHRLPVMYGSRSYVEDGGLISYAANFADLHRRAALYAHKIFKGAKPGDLPIEQPNKFEIVINLKTAKALGMTIPESILLSADKVIG